MLAYIIMLWFVSLLFSYSIMFNRATLDIGKSISDTDSSTGYQDAITPPWSTKLMLVSFVVSIGTVISGWYQYGWLIGIAITISYLVLVQINIAVLLPKRRSNHFRHLIIRSMMIRYADFVKTGDIMRASAMAALLEKLDVPVPDLLGS